MAAELQNQLDKLNNQARFVNMIVDKEITVANRKKADIVVELRKKGFRPFPKVASAKAAGEEEAVSGSGDEEENEGSASDYDYLLGMAIWSLTREKVNYTAFQERPLLTDMTRSRDYCSRLKARSLSCLNCSSELRFRCGIKTWTNSWPSGRCVGMTFC
jgi:hypothetical protein